MVLNLDRLYLVVCCIFETINVHSWVIITSLQVSMLGMGKVPPETEEMCIVLYFPGSLLLLQGLLSKNVFIGLFFQPGAFAAV